MRSNRNINSVVKVRVSTLTIGELKAANSIHLDNYFLTSFVTKYNSDVVRRRLVAKCPKIFTW